VQLGMSALGQKRTFAGAKEMSAKARKRAVDIFLPQRLRTPGNKALTLIQSIRVYS
jgi:hypothetical protein